MSVMSFSSDDRHGDRDAALRLLLSRQSSWPLTEPGPSDVELDIIADVAVRAPDHGRLSPWRLVLIRGEAREVLADVLVDIAAAREPGTSREAHLHRRQKAYAAPVIIALGAALSTHTKVPESEQLLSVGAAAMNMLNAIHALGYGGFWSTGPDSYSPALHNALGFSASERFLGFLFVGTPDKEQRQVQRVSGRTYVREWQGESKL